MEISKNIVSVLENEKFGNIRVIMSDNDEILFCGSDIAKALCYKRPNDAISLHCRYTEKRSIPHPQSSNKNIEMIFIKEGDVYRLISHSKLKSAENFERWIFDEVLPTIRKTGGYVANDELFVETYLPFAEKPVKELFKLQLLTIRQLNEKLDITTKELTETKKELTIANDTIEENRPKVEFAEHVSKSADSIDISTFAKLLHDKNNNVGRNKFYKWLRQNKYLMSDKAHYNLPYQSWINQKILELKEIVYESSCGKQIVPKVYITGKGQLYIINKLRKEFPIAIQM